MISNTRKVIVVFLALIFTSDPLVAQDSPIGTIYSAVWPGEILVMDEETGEIRDKIPLRLGAAFNLELSPDRKRFYANTGLMEGIEVIDIESRKVVDAFKMSEGNRKIRVVRRFTAHPDNKRVFAVVRVAVKGIDRYTIEEPQLVTIDLEQRKITKSVEIPREYSRGQSPLMRVSPDGKFLYYLYRDFLVFDVDSLEIVEKVELSRPVYPGSGTVRLGRFFESYDEPYALTFLFNSTDPTTGRGMMGVARFDFSDRSLDYFETNPSVGLGDFAVSPDGKRAYGVRNAVDQHEIYEFDLEQKRLVRKQAYEGRPRTSLKVSSDGQKVYLHHAGNTIDYFDAETLMFEKRVELPADFTARMIVVPNQKQ